MLYIRIISSCQKKKKKRNSFSNPGTKKTQGQVWILNMLMEKKKFGSCQFGIVHVRLFSALIFYYTKNKFRSTTYPSEKHRKDICEFKRKITFPSKLVYEMEIITEFVPMKCEAKLFSKTRNQTSILCLTNKSRHSIRGLRKGKRHNHVETLCPSLKINWQ